MARSLSVSTGPLSNPSSDATAQQNTNSSTPVKAVHVLP